MKTNTRIPITVLAEVPLGYISFYLMGFGTKMATHSGGIFESFIKNSPLLIEYKNNIVPKPNDICLI